MRVLIVDESADFRAVLAETLRAGVDAVTRAAVLQGLPPPPQVRAREWDPVVQGVPRERPGGFTWNFDVILIDSNVAPADPLEWLAAVRASVRTMPPVVMLTSERDLGALIVSAMKQGVVDCVPRMELSAARLYDALTEAVREREQQRTLEYQLRNGIPTPVELASAGYAVADEAPEIPGYVIERLIGEGGTARVYLARREADGLQLVLKVLLRELMGEVKVIERFMQEFSLIQKIQSVHVTRIFDFNYDRGNAYLAMEYFGGGDLRERIRLGMPPLQAIKLFAQIARALEAIHNAGVVHRDLKPHNIMFRDQHHLAIVDFGGAKALDEKGSITKVGHIVGTPNFMSPEQILGRDLDPRSDLYSLGVILHQLLTGRTLYRAPTTSDLMELHVSAPIPRLPDKLLGFQTLLNRLVAKNPDDRFGSAQELYAHIVA